MHSVKPPQCKECLQLNCLINKCCSKQWKTYLDKHKLFITYKKGQTIFREGNLVLGAGFIYKGKIKVFNTGKNDKQNIFRLAASGEMLGLRSFAEKTYLVSAGALEDSSLCFFEKEIFLKTLKENSEFAISIIQFYAHELSNIEIRQRNSNQLGSKGKVAEALLILKNKYGKLAGKNDFFLDVVLTRQEMADIAGVCVEELIRTLTFFKKEQIIKKSKQKIIISNQSKLREFIL